MHMHIGTKRIWISFQTIYMWDSVLNRNTIGCNDLTVTITVLTNMKIICKVAIIDNLRNTQETSLFAN